MKIAKKDLLSLIESLLLEGRGRDGRTIWHYSPDSDFPAATFKPSKNIPFGKSQKHITDPLYTALRSKRVLLLRDDDNYTLTKDIDTHGVESHTLKH